MFGLKTVHALVIAAAFAPLALTACGSSPTNYERAQSSYLDNRGEYLEDAALTSKVAAAILDEPRLRDSTIRVATYGNIVQLTGEVDSVRDAYIAEDLAASVIGVRRVDNDLVVN
jgi:osmotically-inducible protein OsmY